MGCFEKGPSMEAGGGINERMEVSSSEKRTIFDEDQAHDVILFDISCNKKWAAYVTYQKSTLKKDSNVTNENNEERIFITRRKFYEVDQKHPSSYEAEPTEPSVVEHFSLEITELVKNAGLNHCKFLSVSPDGEYVVMSFFERNMIGEIPKIKEPENKHCLIFEVQDNKNLRLKDKIICDGRAVFIGNETYQLAIISTNVVEVYAKFPGNLSVTDVYDLSPFLSGKQQHEELRKDDLYIQNASWADIVTHSENADIKRIMMLSRHIRHNIVTTHFVGNIARVWSIAEDGVRFTSFRAKEENIVAFSKNYKYTATHLENTKSINIYNVKSGLLVYRLKSQAKWSPEFKVSHIRFCYGGRYVAMSGIEGDNVSFEVWYIEAEKSIYRKTIQAKTSLGLTRCKIVYPFVTRGTNENGIKCLKGIYTCFENDKAITGFVELKIDQKAEIDWQTGQRQPYRGGNFEIYNNLGDFNGLKGAYIEADKKECMIRFGQHTVQLWKLAEGRNQKNSPITDEDELLYIRAYKGPDYGVEYSFRENWQIHDFNSIRFIQGEPSGRVLVNITENKDNQSDSTYHTEELFLPLEEPASKPGTPCFELSTTMDLDSAQEVTLQRFDYHKLESACQALHFLTHHTEELNKNKNNRDMLLSKTEAIIKSAVKDIHKESNFFSTISGSRTLAMLASFESGREIIKLIIAKELPISIFSDPRYVKDVGIEDDEQFWIDQRQRALEFWVDQKQKVLKFFVKSKNKDVSPEQSRIDTFSSSRIGAQSEHDVPAEPETEYRSSSVKTPSTEKCANQSIAGNENVLTVLIETLNYDLYKLIFNRILLDSKNLGPGCLSALTDALLFLQEEGNSDLLLSSSEKLSYLNIEKDNLGILLSEMEQILKVKTMQKEYIPSLRNLESHAMMEQIKKYSGLRLQVFRLKQKIHNDKFNDIVHNLHTCWRYSVVYLWKKLFKEARKGLVGSGKVCVVPLPHFNTYSNLPEDRPPNTKETYKERSAFVKIAMDQHGNNIFQQGDTVLEVMLQYKWKTFARWRFVYICLIHAIFYVSYSTGVLFSQELYGHDPEEDFVLEAPGQIVSIVLMSLAILILVIQEMRQFWKTHSRLEYFLSGYNWIDISAFVFPIITAIQLKYKWDYFNEVCSVSTLILWTHAILRLRVISYFGVTLETIIQLCKNVTSVLFIMLLVILAFTQAYIVLLRLEPDEYFQENYGGNYGVDPDDPSGEISVANVSADNGFHNWFKAFSQVWFFIYGVWDPLNDGDAGDSKFLMCISILFSLITVLIFFNLVIALMSSTVEEVKKRGKKVWVSHFAAVVSEIEYLWCLNGARHSRKNNPIFIYYIATEDSVKKRKEALETETKDLKKKLKIPLPETEIAHT